MGVKKKKSKKRYKMPFKSGFSSEQQSKNTLSEDDVTLESESSDEEQIHEVPNENDSKTANRSSMRRKKSSLSDRLSAYKASIEAETKAQKEAKLLRSLSTSCIL